MLGALFVGGGLATGGQAQAQVLAPNPVPHIDVVQINGLIDPIEADFLTRSIRAAADGKAVALVVQLSSRGGVISRTTLDALTSTISQAAVPVAVWVGPNGSRAYGAAYAIFRAAPLRGVAPGTRVGNAPPPDPLAGRTLSAEEALAQGIATINAPTLGDFVVSLDGQTVAGQTLHTAQVVQANGEQRRRPTVDTRFKSLGLLQQLLHTVASPSVAYLLLVVGLLLAALEFFTAGIGIAAFCAAGCLLLASYGFGVLPFRVWALVLIGVGILGFCIDLQAGVPRVWTGIGAVALIVGSLRLFQAGAHLSPFALVAGVVGTALFMLAGMPAMVRARFSTPTIGRQSIIGEMGVALVAIEPEGTVEVRGAPWRARTNRATPIGVGAPIRVVAIDGLLLEVEPETGGARDARH
ncbi:MAG TPA: NfeD family protein [Acidimicrobiales bacterium]|nr:NfeD family protein [Acidimicrobiales bacterium]